MPSETLGRVLRTLEPRISAYHAAVAGALDELRAQLARERSAADGSSRRFTSELGSFAEGRIDVDRFAALFSGGGTLDEVALDRIEAAAETLAEVLEWGVELHRVQVEEGGDLCAAVRSALAAAGRGFAAARAAEAARTRRYRPEEHDHFLYGLAFARWSRAERLAAPPLVVEVDGRDAHAAALVNVLDGALKVVLVLRGDAPPAPLVRLITPGIWVAQLGGVEALEALPELIQDDAPAVVALVPQGCARFVHRPVGGAELGGLHVEHLPAEAPRRPLGSYGVFQQSEELRQLAALATTAAAMEAVTRAPASGNGHGALAPASPADKLAAWLLEQARLPEGS